MNEPAPRFAPIDRDGALVSVVIPVYNEERTILAVLEKVRALELRVEMIVVDDGSTDGTPKILAENEEEMVLRCFRLEENAGKGAALRRGFAEAKGDIVIVQDADLEYDPGEIPLVLEPIFNDEADVVYGSRFRGGDHGENSSWLGTVANKLITRAINRLTGLDLTDVETGQKAFRAEVLRRIELREERFGIELEMTAKAARMGARIREVGVSYRARSYEEGKKIGWRDGISAVRCVLRYGLGGR